VVTKNAIGDCVGARAICLLGTITVTVWMHVYRIVRSDHSVGIEIL
jgi:hypothetical protein